jgi:tetratricopeptide (TPR) repeat protein
MRQKAFKSDPLPLTLGREKYLEGIRTQLPVDNRINQPVNLKNIVQFAGRDDRKYMVDLSGRGDYVNYLPTNKFLIDVDTSVVFSNGTVKKYFRDRLFSPMIWEYSDNNAFKADLAIMDLLSTNKWNRPVYISSTVSATQYKGLEKFFVQEGIAFRIVPIKIDESDRGEYGMIDPYVMYDNMMNKFKWGNAADPSVYLDENNRRMLSNFRRLFGNLGKALLQVGDSVKAIEAVQRGLEIIPHEKLPNDLFSINLAEVLLKTGRQDEGMKIIDQVLGYSKEYLEYAKSLRSDKRFGYEGPISINMQALYDIYNLSVNVKLDSLSNSTAQLINNYYDKFYSRK